MKVTIENKEIVLDEFTASYIECMLWIDYDNNDRPIEENYSVNDFTLEAIESIVEDCRAFQSNYSDDLQELDLDSYCGHDYYLTRNHHGAGFWDRGYETEIANRLTKASHNEGSSNAYINDEDKIDVN